VHFHRSFRHSNPTSDYFIRLSLTKTIENQLLPGRKHRFVCVPFVQRFIESIVARTATALAIARLNYRAMHTALIDNELGLKMPDWTYNVPGFTRDEVKHGLFEAGSAGSACRCGHRISLPL
jgi:hypothetical protein